MTPSPPLRCLCVVLLLVGAPGCPGEVAPGSDGTLFDGAAHRDGPADWASGDGDGPGSADGDAAAAGLSAVIRAAPTEGYAPLTVALDGSGSRAGASAIATYAWDLDGDGPGSAQGKKVSHTLAKTGAHQVTLTVTDGAGASHRATATVKVLSHAAVTLFSEPFDTSPFPSRWKVYKADCACPTARGSAAAPPGP